MASMMGRITWTIGSVPNRIRLYLVGKQEHCKLMYRTLLYNEFTSFNSCLDLVMEPMFWFVDHFARYLGPIMVTFVVLMITFVVTVFYTCLFPHIYYTTDLVITISHLVFGNWLLVNIVFHYIMGAFRNAGHPPLNVQNSVSICKKCISPKPPRAHHCSVCKSCILKMDHHCPWLNNCIGFYNHHHFYLFCFYMWIGTMYISIVGYDLFKQHFSGSTKLVFPDFRNLFYGKKSDTVETVTVFNDEQHKIDDSINIKKEDQFIISYSDEMFHNLVILEFLICTGVSIALGLLTLWHSRLISRGETSIEAHINNKERKRLKKKGIVFKNPYNLGFIANWKQFFGADQYRSFWRLVLWPSFHTAAGDGLLYKTSTYQLRDKQGLQLL